MAERRMFAKTIVLSDAFLDMPMSARCLYFTLGMFADDDGFVNNPKSITRQCGASNDDMNILISKKFVLLFDDGVVVIKHWRINNYLRSDRYVSTLYEDDKARLMFDENNSYKLKSENDSLVYQKAECGIPKSEMRYPQDRLGKDSIGYIKEKDTLCVSEKKVPDGTAHRFQKPTVEEIRSYCEERKNNVDAERFFDWYESNGWRVGGRSPMKDWRACVRTWEKRDNNSNKQVKSITEEYQRINALLEAEDEDGAF